MEMPELLDENIFDILSRLPVKSLMRFKCVSKQWCSLVSDPQFIRAHFSRLDQMRTKMLATTSHEAWILDVEDGENLMVELNYPVAIQSWDWVNFVGSCDGLVCLLLDDYTFIVWNPSTSEFRQSPPAISVSSDVYNHYSNFYGFGYDSSIDDYKIVIGYSSKSSVRDCLVQVLALKSNKWKFITFHKLGYYIEDSSIFLNGNLYWISEDRQPKPDGVVQLVVLSFNIKEEKFTEVVQFPMDWHAARIPMGLYAFENSLFLLNCYRNAERKYFEVWEKNMDGVEDSWKKLYCVPLGLLRETNADHLHFTRDNKLLLGLRSMIRMYNLETMTTDDSADVGSHLLDGIAYLQTLVSPN